MSDTDKNISNIDGAKGRFVESYIPTTRNAFEYNMHHPKRGIALIFNQVNFKNNPMRPGAAKDLEGLKGSFGRLGFDVIPYVDSTISEVFERTKQVAELDHTDNDCLVIVISSHGDGNGYVQARNGPYCLDAIFKMFTADLCPTLAGKPKLFFIQACRGEQLDSGHNVERRLIVRDGLTAISNTGYRIPLHADFLMAYSSIPDYASWHNRRSGSWFIQALVKELDENAEFYDIFSILTLVNRRMALDFESFCPDEPEKDYKKQISCFTSMLTRLLRFPNKS